MDVANHFAHAAAYPRRNVPAHIDEAEETEENKDGEAANVCSTAVVAVAPNFVGGCATAGATAADKRSLGAPSYKRQ